MRFHFLRQTTTSYLCMLERGRHGTSLFAPIMKYAFSPRLHLINRSLHTTVFQPKRVLILTKLSRLEFEKLRQPEQSDGELESVLRHRGSDYSTLLYHHYIHKGCESRVHKCFQEFGVETRLVNRFDYTQENIDWADVIVTTGGDGTFLMAANRIQDRNKPVIGFNTDPTRSEGYLCLPKKYSVNVREAVRKLFEGKFLWTFRRRIRITLTGECVFEPPVELHDQQLAHPEFRFFDCLQEQHQSAATCEAPANSATQRTRVLPVLALNEVYFGECVSARVSYVEVGVDGGEKVKSKNAGLCVTTGTGSTSWSYNINKISTSMVKDLFKIIEEDENEQTIASSGIPQNKVIRSTNKLLIDRITSRYNNQLIFSPESGHMQYTIRDPISSYTLPYANEICPRGLAKRLDVRSRCFDACLVIDGGLSFSFNDGTHATLEVHDSDALRTIVDVSNCGSEIGNHNFNSNNDNDVPPKSKLS
ncbi:NAD kinase 2, mitochondrial [Orchesella cincta]|uniref:NAD kinase 2, mitochondrial n=1 Tax=Orchesella cincta TaxID=48709 RepID=A0A1D2MPS0_ORCCI|nr:NAD kinase 2, mitochondrial [Orchesella cincta]